MAPGLSKKQKIGLIIGLAVGSMTITKNKRRQKWVKEYLLMREKLTTMNIISYLEPADYRIFLRMDSRSFNLLLNLVTPYIERQDTFLRGSISAKERLIVTLRFLATGNSYQDMRFSSLISQPMLSRIIPETCWTIYSCLKHYIKMGLLAAIAVNVVGGGAIYLTGGLATGLVAPMLGFGSAGIAAGSTAAAAQAYYGNLVAGSVISQLTAAAMVAPTP